MYNPRYISPFLYLLRLLSTENTTSLSLSLSLDTFRLDLCYQLLLHRSPFLFRGVLHGLDFDTVRAVLVVCTEDSIPPAERGREVVGESHMVEVVVLGAGPEGKDVVQRPREIITAVSIDSLEQPKYNPDVDSDNVEILREEAIDERAEDGASPEDENFRWVGVFSGQTEGSRVFVMNFVDVLIEDASVEGLVGDEVEEILKAEEEEDLGSHGLKRWEGNMVCLHPESFSGRVEKPNQG